MTSLGNNFLGVPKRYHFRYSVPVVVLYNIRNDKIMLKVTIIINLHANIIIFNIKLLKYVLIVKLFIYLLQIN